MDNTAGPNAGCATSATVTITVNPTPTGVTATASPATLCAGNNISLTSAYTASSIPFSGMDSYTATRTTGASYTSIIPATTITSWRNTFSTDDNLSDNQPIGFSFSYNGNTYTNFRVSTNGFITFNTTSTAIGNGASNPYSYTNDWTIASAGSIVAPNWDDLQTAANAGTQADLNNSINYTTTGSAGSRVLTVEWKNMQDFATTSNGSYNFQVKLFEADGHIELVYGTMTVSTNTPSISYSLGLSAATVSTTPTAPQLLSQTTQNTATFGFTNSTALATIPATNTKVSFNLPQPVYSWTGPNGFTSSAANPTITSATTAASGIYNLVVSNPTTLCASAQASTVTVTVNQPAAITMQPTDANACSAAAATFTVVASGTSVSYQWQESVNGGTFSNISNGGVYSGATSASLSISDVTGKNGNRYQVVVTGTSACTNTVTSNPKTLNVSNTWVNSGTDAWATGSNWSCNVTPGAGDNVIIPGGGTQPLLPSNITVGNIAFSSNATITIGSNTLTINGAVSGSGSLSGSSTSNLIIGGTAGTLYFTSGSRILKDLTLNASATATLGTPLEITAGASPATNGTVIIGSGATLASGGNLTIKSNEFGTARVGNSAGTITGNVTVERFIPQRGASATGGRAYRLMASTVNTTGTIRANWMEGGLVASVGGTSNLVPGYGTHITGNSGNTNNFDVTQSNAPSLYLASNGTITSLTYTPVGSTTTGVGASLNALTGYFLYIRGDRSVSLQVPLGNNMPTTSTTLRTTGTLVTGPVSTFTNGYTGGGAHNLVTNPYPSPIDWSMVQPASSGITDFYTYWNPNFGDRGAFVTVNKTELGPTRYIQSGQAFFVESNGAVPVVNILESHKASGNNNGVFLVEPPPVESFKTELYFTEANGFRRIADRVTALYDNAYSAAVDSKDAKEIGNWDENIAIFREGKRLAIEGRPVIMKSDDLPIYMNNMKKKAYEIEFTPLVFTNTNLKAELIDNYLGTRTLLSVVNPTVVSFTITDDAASKATDRFKVVFGAFGSPTGVDAITIKASQKNNGVQVDWTSKTETDMLRYEVEKSTYGTNFVKANSTIARGNSTTPVDYNWFDTNPNMGTNFYRVKGIDKAGNVRYSEMVRVLFGKGEPSIVVYPNPMEGRIFKMDMYNLVKGTYVLNLYSNDGRLVHSEQLQHDGSQATRTINLKGDIAKGAYQLQLMSDNGFKTSKILIKN